ncbi:MAG: ATP-dependent Clp protease proteolytic subunit [Clostridiales Family XIII bacterium]|jgi:ATP-dependent Clp protease protease subunit|nr:ATP-dependent Clp protease proteolytic subunit [Clostridiales Family XIII bacterium]
MRENYGKYDITYRLLRDRVIILDTNVHEFSASEIVKQLMLLDAEDPSKDIQFYINSRGGNIYDGLMIIDTMKMIRPRISTIVLGNAMSMGAVIASSGTKGKRYATKNATMMIHQVIGGVYGQESDFAIEAKEMARLKKELTQMLADNTGQTFEQVEADTDRNNYLTATDALAYGLVDKII